MRRCFRCCLIGLFFLIAISPTLAYALPYNTVIYGPMTSGIDDAGQPTVEVGVCAFGRYDSAMVALGYGSDFIHNLSSDDRAKLSNQSTGGDFWVFAQKFDLAPDNDWSIRGIQWMSFNKLYGYGNVWRGLYKQGEAANAKRDLLEILAGGSLGGGGTGVGVGFVTSYYSSSSTPSSIGYVQNGDAKYVSLFPAPDGYTLLPSKINIDSLNIPDAPSGYKNRVVIALSRGNWSTAASTIHVQRVPDTENVVEVKRPNSLRDNYIYQYQNKTDGTITWYAARSSLTLYYDSGTLKARLSGSLNFSSRIASKNDYFGVVASAYGQLISDADAASTPVVPPSNWPDAPEVESPTAPDVPEPTDSVQTPQPAEPTSPTLPTFPLLTVQPDVSYDTPDLGAVLDAMNEHCQHLQSAIYQGFADYFDTFTPWLDERLELLQECIRGESVWQIQRIDADFESLKDYLHDLFQWLADQMEFTFTGDSYDDSSVISWLRRIYYKLQSSPVNTRPADPVANPDGAWDWLSQLLQDILTGLTGGATELVGKLMTLFDGIKDKFPFSVPWDLAAVLVLLDVPAHTPAFTVSYDVFGTTVTYDIDLHFMDDYAGVIRSMETVLFCFMLIKNTKWVTGVFDEVGQFLGTKLGYRG